MSPKLQFIREQNFQFSTPFLYNQKLIALNKNLEKTDYSSRKSEANDIRQEMVKSFYHFRSNTSK